MIKIEQEIISTSSLIPRSSRNNGFYFENKWTHPRYQIPRSIQEVTLLRYLAGEYRWEVGCSGGTKLDRVANLATPRFVAKYHATFCSYSSAREKRPTRTTLDIRLNDANTNFRTQLLFERRVSKRTTALSFVDGRRKFLENSCSPNFQNLSWRGVVVVFGILEVDSFCSPSLCSRLGVRWIWLRLSVRILNTRIHNVIDEIYIRFNFVLWFFFSDKWNIVLSHNFFLININNEYND